MNQPAQHWLEYAAVRLLFGSKVEAQLEASQRCQQSEVRGRLEPKQRKL